MENMFPLYRKLSYFVWSYPLLLALFCRYLDKWIALLFLLLHISWTRRIVLLVTYFRWRLWYLPPPSAWKLRHLFILCIQNDSRVCFVPKISKPFMLLKSLWRKGNQRQKLSEVHFCFPNNENNSAHSSSGFKHLQLNFRTEDMPHEIKKSNIGRGKLQSAKLYYEQFGYLPCSSAPHRKSDKTFK